ncbi:hypothetical protein Gotri_015032, partial [Gossypium trilobum]|nr:hypothetical protein [Gossypium trilobum]
MGDGRSVRCWKDVWLPDIGPLINQIPSHVNLGMDCILRDMVTDEGLWNLELFRVLLSNDIIKHIARTKSGEFSIKSAYTMLGERSWNQMGANWGEAVAGGVVKDSHGHWILGFNRRLGLCSVFNTELLGILDGLIVIHNKRWEKVSIRTDSLEVIQAIKEAFTRPSYSALIRYIQQIL